jgi:hypothetical protein
MSNTRNTIFKTLILTGLTVQLGVSCSSEPDRRTAPPPPADSKSEATAEQPSQPEMVFEGPGELLAKSFGPWSIDSAPRYFGPDNLFDLINGGAEIYAEYGLVKMVTADYKGEGQPSQTITVEIYDMGSPRGAFGRTARFLDGLADPTFAGNGLPVGLADQGILGDGDAIFWKGKYLVHLTLLDENPAADPAAIAAEGKKILPVFAVAISGSIAANAPIPEVFAAFPADGRIARSEMWHPGDVLAIKGLGAGFTVRYAKGKVGWTAFVSNKFTDDAAAEAAWAAVKSAEAEGRRYAARVAAGRVVGIVQDGEPRLKDKAVEKFVDELIQNLAAK